MRLSNQIIEEILKELKTGIYVKDIVQDSTGSKGVIL